MDQKKYIAFVGDSFCATYEYDPPFQPNMHQGRVHSPAYPSIVARHYQYNIAPYGFGGRSWWYSWSKFWQEWEHKLDQIEAIVFTHTNNDRINSASIQEFPLLANYPPSEATPDMVRVNEGYFKYIHDHRFQEWAQEQYFKMLKEKFNKIKTIHFHCFSNALDKSHLLPGVVFTTPLIHVCVGEVRGSAKQINRALFGDFKPNHFNENNNQAMANLIIQTLNNYIPRVVPLPIEQFEQYNPNADQWPWGTYWTK